ncbi:hypothetical protein KI688_002476 [Linnemannia hyalina]|uniref:Uncharacterized protein n=1 Tax=Linnemannia hyalina TaxID=64524 RepID=A0A9P8BQP8_9FUNG|nr:hypothetical protein KI688_002476 [Linnemannia hyalina]
MPTVTPLGSHGFVPTQSQGIGASAAQLLANLATTPGYISDEAILEYSRQQQQQKLQQQHQQQQHHQQHHQQPYHQQWQQQHTSQWQQPFSQPGPPSNQAQPQTYFAPTQYEQSQSQGYPQDFSHAQPGIQQPHDYRISSDPNAAIGALLKELQHTGGAPSSSASTSSTYPSYSSIPPPIPQQPVPQHDVQPQSQTSQAGFGYQPPSASSSVQQPPQEEKADDFSSGKITPQLLKKLAGLAELDGHNGFSLLNEIKRLRTRQTKTERALHEDREELLNKHKRDLVKLQASEIMGVNVDSEMQRKKSAHHEELKRFDQRVVRAMDKEITLVQESLELAGVPLMSSTQDPGKIATQIRVLRLLEDMLQT